MNINQMKEAIKKFRAADFSGLKDEELRAKAQKLQAKQGGFTLLELLVVITLLAALATAALVAYEGLGENAADASTANSLVSAEAAIRNYRAVENKYPNQWDNLANLDGTILDASNNPLGAQLLLADKTKAFFGQVTLTVPADLTAAGIERSISQALQAVGINELQTLTSAATFTNAIPNLSFNESAPGVTNRANELELWDEDNDAFLVAHGTALAAAANYAVSIVPAGGTGTCTVGAAGPSLRSPFVGDPLTDSSNLNLINDGIDDDACTLVLALGYGKDVPGTTMDSRVAIGQVPTAATADVNPATHYARAIALFQVGEDGSDGSVADGVISATEIFPKARLIGMVDPEGRAIDSTLAAANAGA
jgi:prepilin-type N-terminal cleavage/methylation domain-containing protein